MGIFSKIRPGFDKKLFPYYTERKPFSGDAMNRIVYFGLALLLLLAVLPGCRPEAPPVPSTSLPAATADTEVQTFPPLTAPPLPTEPAYMFTPEEQEMLLKIGMAELGSGDCTQCVALVMRTVLNRVESGRFGSSIRSVLYAQDQFTPVTDGTYDQAQPNQLCQDALDLVASGWDESQGALYYEFCEGDSWHSRNLTLLFQHCQTRFYK